VNCEPILPVGGLVYSQQPEMLAQELESFTVVEKVVAPVKLWSVTNRGEGYTVGVAVL